MTYIEQVPYDEATGLLARLYERYARPDGELDHIIRVHSLNPRSMEGHVRYYGHIVKGPSPLSRAQREMIAVAVSAANDCHYCVNHHGASLREIAGDAALPRALARNPDDAELEPVDRAVVDHALKMTREVGSLEEDDVGALRTAGLSDEAILDVCQVAAYFNYVNRMALALGVELEAYWDEETRVVDAAEFEDWREAARAGR